MASAKKAQKRALITQLKEGGANIPILGWMCFWSIRCVDITQEDYAAILEECGLDPKYAREHNYLSAFKRALKNMEEARIIRIVEEDSSRISCQFTAERETTDSGGRALSYDKETVVEIDKEIYRREKDFGAAVVRGKREIKEALVEHFHREKARYNSQDITRYVQKIFKDYGDIVPLRDQGCLYFVPTTAEEVLLKVTQMVRRVAANEGAFEAVPMVNVDASRGLVGRSVAQANERVLNDLEKDLESVLKEDGQVTERWRDTRLARVQALRDRLNTYAEILGDTGKRMVEQAEEAVKQIGALGVRKLKLD